MEYAEETLSQTLPYRALGPEEVRELLVPTLDALSFLHRENWVQGQLKPSNFLVVDDQLKLATDTIRPAGVPRDNGTRITEYDPPETEHGEVSAAADIWALGVTLVEALSQYPPTWLNGRSEPPSLPTNLPLAFRDTVQRCLSPNPADRPTVAELQAETKPTSPPQQGSPAPLAQQEPVAPVPQPELVIRATLHPSPFASEPPRRSLSAHIIAALVVVLIAAWGGSRLFYGPSEGSRPAEVVPPPPAVSAPAPMPPQASQPAVPQHAAEPSEQRRQQQQPANPPSAVIHEEIPRVPQSARETIHGRVKVAVRVTVDRSGNVVRDTFENAGPSKYFNRLASEAARKWKFASADNEGSREWLLRFEFGREGATVHATRPRS
jgi:TonB family protein